MMCSKPVYGYDKDFKPYLAGRQLWCWPHGGGPYSEPSDVFMAFKIIGSQINV